MNVPAIRAALERLLARMGEDGICGLCEDRETFAVTAAVVRVGLRACDDVAYLKASEDHDYPCCGDCERAEDRRAVIADILRESGVEVGE